MGFLIMAQRYVPLYLHAPAQRGWYSPGVSGGGAQWPGALGFLLEVPPGPQQQESQQPEQCNASSQQPAQQPPISPNDAIINRSEVEVVMKSRQPETKIPKNTRKFRYPGIILCILASAVISLGISNIVVTSLTVMTSDGGLGCFGPSNPKYDSLGPNTSYMKSFDWTWVSVGLWASILIYIAGTMAGTITRPDSVQSRIFATLALISLVFLIPLSLAMSILDSILSQGCKSGNPTKFATPIVIAILCSFEFLTIAYILMKLRKGVRAGLTSSPNGDSVEMTSFKYILPSPHSVIQPSSSTSMTRYNNAEESFRREPNITVINVQPPLQSSESKVLGGAIPAYPAFQQPMNPYRRPYPQVPTSRWYPRSANVNDPRNLFGVRPRNALDGPPSRLFRPMTSGAYNGNFRAF